MTTPSGQYVDRHEQSDVMDHHKKVFLPVWMSTKEQTRRWMADFKDEDVGDWPPNQHTVVWFHNELHSMQMTNASSSGFTKMRKQLHVQKARVHF
jgi:hypothetical protein